MFFFRGRVRQIAGIRIAQSLIAQLGSIGAERACPSLEGVVQKGNRPVPDPWMTDRRRSWMVTGLLIRDAGLSDLIIQERKRKGLDLYDEVWEGMYVMPSMPTLEHQELVHDLGVILDEVVNRAGLGKIYPGINVSDRASDWKQNYRVPDVVVVLKNSRAISRSTRVQWGPDFLVEIESPGDDTEEKVPFYGKIGVRELLIIHRDKRTLRLLRLEGEELVLVQPSSLEGKKWLVSTVLPLAFRRIAGKGTPRTAIRRTDGKPGRWTV
jgi:Uma2 family endonuclease